MSEFDTNYSGICCPFCKNSIPKNRISQGQWVDDLEDEEDDFFQCQICDMFFKAELNICKEYNYIISKPTKAEIKEHNLIIKKDILEDCPGQNFFWKNLFPNKS